MLFSLIPCLVMLALVSGVLVTLLRIWQVEHQQQARVQVLMTLLTHRPSPPNTKSKG
ncbi:MAG: hypothetical protein ETSY2_31230 [Candidatus Entotheonella gemina]|uniref:Uncharacterized protein n=1 Tax=Candidatus Entotheonella gemina TaxID=1429439 RepID=W4M0Z2_9BACT|nr:MAG: hypothetical protein ETSY2_31230 [Candidatus Entotheonella gemina]